MTSPSADVSVRVAWADDAEAIAHVQARAWATSYAGLVPAAGELREAALTGADVVIGDSNRRRVILPSQPRQAEGATLAADVAIPADGAVLDPFDRGPAAQTVAVYSGAHAIRAPFSGRISAANVKVGNFVRPADTTALAVINQMAPVYVTFTVAQKSLPDVRHALASETANVDVSVPGEARRASGAVTMIENAIVQPNGLMNRLA